MEEKNRIDNQSFKRFFFFGVDNKQELKEGILYFSANKVYERHRFENWFDIPNEQLEKEIIQEATPKYRQFYRFIRLNDKSNCLINDVNIEKVEEQVKRQMELLKQEKKVIDTKTGIFFVREREELLKGGQRYIIGEGLKGEEGWTKQIYDILEKLDCMERENPEEYDVYLYIAKLARAINRNSEEEAQRIRKCYEEAKQKLEKKKDLGDSFMTDMML